MVLFWPDLCIVRTLEKIKVYLLVDRGTVHNDAELRVSTNSSPVTQWHRLCLGFISASCRGNHVITMAWTSFLYQGPTFLEELSGPTPIPVLVNSDTISWVLHIIRHYWYCMVLSNVSGLRERRHASNIPGTLNFKLPKYFFQDKHIITIYLNAWVIKYKMYMLFCTVYIHRHKSTYSPLISCL